MFTALIIALDSQQLLHAVLNLSIPCERRSVLTNVLQLWNYSDVIPEKPHSFRHILPVLIVQLSPKSILT